MAQPRAYVKTTTFNDFSTTNPSDPHSGSDLDTEFVEIRQNTDDLNSNIALLQRDDGKLSNEAVHKDSFDQDSLALIGLSGYTVRGAWVTATAYAVGDIVTNNEATYLNSTVHTSDTFSTDTANWTLLANAAINVTGHSVDTLNGLGTINLQGSSWDDEARVITHSGSPTGTPVIGQHITHASFPRGTKIASIADSTHLTTDTDSTAAGSSQVVDLSRGFTLSFSYSSDTDFQVFIAGVLTSPSLFAVSGTTLTFTTGPASGTGNIIVWGGGNAVEATKSQVTSYRDDALDHRDTAQDYATRVGATVRHFDGATDNVSDTSPAAQSGVYSAKEHAEGTTVTTGSAKEWADKIDGAVNTTFSAKAYAQGGTGVDVVSGSAKDWATKATTPSSTATDASAKEWAIGVSTHKNDASAKEYATSAQYDSVEGSAEYSAKHYSAQAQDWAVKTDGQVRNDANGADVDYSAKEWATDTNADIGSAKDWATDTAAIVASTDYSSKEWAAGQLAGNTNGSAKQWSIGGGAFVEGTAVTGSSYSAKKYATDSAASATAASASETAAAASETAANASADAVSVMYDAFHDKFLGSMADDAAQGTNPTPTGQWLKNSSTITVSANTNIKVGQVVTGAGIPSPSDTPPRPKPNVISIDGTAIVISDNMAAVSASSTVALTFTGYGIYGDFNGGKDGPALNNDGDALADGMLYFNTSDDVMLVYDETSSAWKRTTPTTTEQTAINTTATNIAQVQNFAEVYKIAGTAPTSPTPTEGDLWFDTGANVVNVYTGSEWIVATTSGYVPDDGGTFDGQVTFDGPYIRLPNRTTGERDAVSAAVGMMLYNTTLGIMQQYNTQGWASIDSPPTVTSLNYPGNDTALDIAGEFNISCTTQSNTEVLVPGSTMPSVGQIVKGTGISTVSNLTCGLTDEDATVTVAGSTTGLVVGMTVAEFAGVPLGATILSIITDTSFELSADATATNASAVLSFNTTVVSVSGTTSFVIAPTATASATVTLTFNTQTLVITGTNFQTGITVAIDGTAPSTVTKDSSTQITVTGTPAKTTGTKVDGLVVSNANGLAGSINIDYSALPGWTTASGTVLTANEGSTISTVDLNGGADATSYAITSGAIPASLAMSTSTGDITGTLSASPATYNFTVNAIDAQAQSSPRLFNIIVVALPSGGNNITSTGGYRYHTFTADGTFVVPISLTADVLVVGGGGGGGARHGGGGGGGGVVHAVGITLAAGSYTADVGLGGTGYVVTVPPHTIPAGDDGIFSKFNLSTTTVLTGLGGGGGGCFNGDPTGNTGGSSGGYCGHETGTHAAQAATQPGQAQTIVSGGSTNYGSLAGGHTVSGASGASGGGGANDVGTPGANSGTGGTGGDGIQLAMGTIYALKGSGDNTTNLYWAGGGGGAGYGASGQSGNTGGLGAGGGAGGGNYATASAAGTGGLNAGTAGLNNIAGGNGGTNTGSGGGGNGEWTDSGAAGDGGSGIIVIRYLE